MSKVSVRGAARHAHAENKAAARKKTGDSFANFAANLGVGTDNISSGGTYGFNPITRNRILLEWIHRGSWVGGMAVDVVANDMTREGVELKGDDLDPKDATKISEAATAIGLWAAVNEGTKWARLYGGSLVVPLIDGANFETPFRADRVQKGSLKGFLTLDRWMADPSLEDLVSEYGPNYGMPKYYRVTGDAPGLRGVRIHHSRVLRQVGDSLPYWQRIMENMWGTSVYERMYDRLLAFDSATQGAAQLVYKAWLRKMKIKGLREIVSAGGAKMNGLTKYVDMLRRFQSIEGIALIDADDELEAMQHSAFGGLSDALMQFGQQLAGALQIPLVRLFGMSPSGFNSTGESDLKTYYDGILQRQEQAYRVPLTDMYRCLATSLGIILPEGFTLEFRPLWQMTEKEKAEVSQLVTQTVVAGVEGLGIDPKTAAKELNKSSEQTGVWTHLDEEAIELIADPKEEEAPPAEIPKGNELNLLKGGKAGDHAATIAALGMNHGVQVVVESPKGSIRQGVDSKTGEAWSVRMPADYGYIRGTVGADADQVDCYLGPDAKSTKVFVIHQNDRHTGAYDEDKVMLGFSSLENALVTYTLGHSHAGLVFGSIEEITPAELVKRVLPGRAA